MKIINGTDSADVLGTNDEKALVNGGKGDDQLTGGALSSTLSGGEGNDTLIGGDGTTNMIGGDGNDLFITGDGDANIYGGTGNNTIDATQGYGSTSVVLEDGDNTILGGEGDLNVVVTGGGKTTITLGNGDANLTLGDGNDVITGGDGSAIIYGGGGDDEFHAGDTSGSVLFDGGEGNDVIELGEGGGVVTGGEGEDTIVFGPDGSQNTVITDFDPEKDTIDLSNFTGAVSFESDGEGGTRIIIGGNEIHVPGVEVDEVEEATETNPDAPCFLRGTMVLTPDGDVAVETLRIGDLVTTASGPMPIKWIGRRSHSARFIPRAPKIAPVRFQAGSLGDNVPSRDLYVSHDHAMFIDGVFVDASQLVNGANVTREFPGGRMVDYFHLEFETHAVVFTHGAASESYVNHDNRALFQNSAEYAALYGDDAPAPVLAEGGHARSHRTVKDGPELAAIRDRIMARVLPENAVRRVA